MIHGRINGFSRRIMFLHCSTNNESGTVLELFENAVTKYGLPSLVRAYPGTENVLVARFMLHDPLRGVGRGSFREELPQPKDRMAMARCFCRMHKCVLLFIYTS